MRIHAVQTGTVAVTERQRRGTGRSPVRQARTMLDRNWTAPLPILAWAVEHDEGVIVVDTGETARAAERGYFPPWHPYFRLAVRMAVRADEEIGPALDRLGVEREGARVVLTHLHTDHSGGLGHFPGCEILVSRVEHSLASSRLGKLRGYLPHRWPDWLAPTLVEPSGDPWGPFPASVPLTASGDVRIVPTPGHTPGHLSVVADTGDTVYFLAGDTSYTEELLLERVVDGVAPDAAAARRTLDRILALARERPTVYLPAHDPDSAERLRETRTVQAG